MTDTRTIAPDADPAFELLALPSGYGNAFGQIWQTFQGRGGLFAFQVGEAHLNQNRVCHGGAMTTFADIALGRASRAALAEDNVFVVTVSLGVDFMVPAGLGSWVVADVSVLRRTGRMVFVQAGFRIGDEVVASARGVFAIRQKR